MILIEKEYPLNSNYLIYSDGKIYSKKLKKFLIPKKNWDGYDRLQIWKDGKCKFISWHRIVADTFLTKSNENDVVNHKNGIKNDNRVENLEWVTQKENIKHSIENGFTKPQIKNNPKTSKKVVRIDEEGKQTIYDSVIEAFRQTGIHRSNIRCACLNGSFAGKYKWRYYETSND